MTELIAKLKEAEAALLAASKLARKSGKLGGAVSLLDQCLQVRRYRSELQSEGLTMSDCPRCNKRVTVEYGWIMQHRQPESSAICEASGTYKGEQK